MFRPIRRVKREIDIKLAKELLVKERRGVIAVNGADVSLLWYGACYDSFYDTWRNPFSLAIFLHKGKFELYK